MRLILFLVLLTFIFASQIPLEVSAAVDSLVICKNEKEVRTIQVRQKNEEDLFVTLYTKGRAQQEVARAKNRDVCDGVMDNIMTNLKASGWACKEVAKATETHLEKGK